MEKWRRLLELRIIARLLLLDRCQALPVKALLRLAEVRDDLLVLRFDHWCFVQGHCFLLGLQIQATLAVDEALVRRGVNRLTCVIYLMRLQAVPAVWDIFVDRS